MTPAVDDQRWETSVPFTFWGYDGSFSWILVASALLDLLGLGMLIGRGGWDRSVSSGCRPLTVSRLGVLLTLFGMLWLAKAVILWFLGVRHFGQLNLAFHTLVYVVPLCAIGLLLPRPWRPLTPLVRGLAWMSLLTVPVGGYAWYVAPRLLVVERTEVRVAPDRRGDAPLRIAVLADLQTDRVTSYEHRVLDRLAGEKPDAILIPGDMFQGSSETLISQASEYQGLLSRLTAPAGVYLVHGDCDHRPFLEALLKETTIVLVHQEVIRFECKGWTVTLGGLDRRSLSSQRVVRQLEETPGIEDLRIALVHQPRAVDWFSANTRVDLIVAGHTHGGQVVIPGVGPPITLSPLPRHVAAGGLHELDGRQLYISRGIGMERGQAPRIRLFCRPELSILTVRAKHSVWADAGP